MTNYYLKEYEEAKKRKASKEHIERMRFLSMGINVDKMIDEWVDNVNSFWFTTNENRNIILHKAIQYGIQIALDIRKLEDKAK